MLLWITGDDVLVLKPNLTLDSGSVEGFIGVTIVFVIFILSVLSSLSSWRVTSK